MPKSRITPDERHAEEAAINARQDARNAARSEAEKAVRATPEAYEPEKLLGSLAGSEDLAAEAPTSPANAYAAPPPSTGRARGGSGSTGWDSMSVRATQRDQIERPGWHSVIADAAVTESWEAVVEASEVLTKAIKAVSAVEAEQHSARSAYASKAADAAERGAAAPKMPPRIDVDAIRAGRIALVGVRRTELIEARSNYDRVVEDSGIVDRLVEEGAPASLSAAKDAVEAALAKVTAAVEVRSAATKAATRDRGYESVPQPGGWHELASKLQAVLTVLQTAADLPIAQAAMQPSRFERQVIATGNDYRQLAWLNRIERSEQFRRTQFTAGLHIEESAHDVY